MSLFKNVWSWLSSWRTSASDIFETEAVKNPKKLGGIANLVNVPGRTGEMEKIRISTGLFL